MEVRSFARTMPSLFQLGCFVVATASAYWIWTTDVRVSTRRIVAVADLHGDYDHALAVLRNTGIIAPDSTEWIAGSDVLVSTGDSVDRGDDTFQLYKLYHSLREQSAKAGGEVINLLGNHEMMNALHDWRYVTPGDLHSFGGPAKRRHAMSVDGWVGQEWLDWYNVTATVPLLPLAAAGSWGASDAPAVTFVHGGITPAWAAIGTDEINALGHDLLLKALSDPHPNGSFPPNTTKAEQALWSPDGPFWYRGYAVDETAAACATVQKALPLLGSQYMVMGHTPHLGGFQVRCENEEIMVIDTGISRAYGGRQSALEILVRYTQHKARQATHHTLETEFRAAYVGHATERLHLRRLQWK